MRRLRWLALRAPWALPTLLAALLRLYGVGDAPLGMDEGSSLFYARWGLSDLWQKLPQMHQHPPLFFALLGGWLAWGDTPAFLRLPAALCSIAAVPATWALARVVAGRRAAAWAAWLIAIAPFSVRDAQQARMYALLELEAVAAAWGCARLLRGARGAAPWVVYGLATAAAPYTYHAGFLVFVATNAAWLAAGRPLPARAWLLAQVPALAAWSFWAGGWITQATGVWQRYWIPGNASWLAQNLLEWAGGLALLGNYGTAFDARWIVAAIGATAGLLAIARGLWVARGDRVRVGLLAAVVLAPPAVEALVSLGRPVLLARTLAWILPTAAVAAGLALARTTGRTRRFLWAATILLGSAATLHSFYTRAPAEPWDWVARTVADRAAPGDAVLFLSPLGQPAFEYYAERSGLRLPAFGAPLSMAETGSREPRVTPAAAAALEARLAAHPRIWLVRTQGAPYVDPGRLVREMLLRTRRWEMRETRGRLEVSLYAR